MERLQQQLHFVRVIFVRLCCCHSQEAVTPTVSQTVSDEIRRVAVVRLSAKLHSCQFVVDADGKAKVCIFSR